MMIAQAEFADAPKIFNEMNTFQNVGVTVIHQYN